MGTDEEVFKENIRSELKKFYILKLFHIEDTLQRILRMHIDMDNSMELMQKNIKTVSLTEEKIREAINNI